MKVKQLWKIIDSNTRAVAANYGGALAQINQYPIGYGHNEGENRYLADLVHLNHEIRADRFQREYEKPNRKPNSIMESTDEDFDFI